eukprot:CAMPEP_0117449888 /NCGR_PEP_ID=MMETSP0759-20121206/8179_1 /TAXON_ID=63605 /ORGANISM="Percolomonas cosmopolitus, Strain WS" /LENGTH=249 /DNA_ID=CAMNT_0005242381 /DNA_START=8 /DNA_END=757 /DNA_ORIENTATION=+
MSTLLPSYPNNPSFITDQSLLSIARHLRLLGHSVTIDDTSHQYRLYLAKKHPNNVLLLHENALKSRKSASFLEKRLGMGSNLSKGEDVLAPQNFFIVKSNRKADQLLEVTKAFRLTFSQERVFSICRQCNGAIVPISDLEKVQDKVFDSVRNKFTKYFQCEKCDKIYWGCDDVNDEAQWHTHYKKAIQYAKRFSYHGENEHQRTTTTNEADEDGRRQIDASTAQITTTHNDASEEPKKDSLPVLPVLEL